MKFAWKNTIGLFVVAGGLLSALYYNPLKVFFSKRYKAHFTLQLLHASDQEGGIEAIEDAPRMSSVLRALKRMYPKNTLIASSGDNYITGPFFRASSDGSMRSLLGHPSPGRGDIAIINAMGFQVSALGNHEFDAGTNVVATLLPRKSKRGRTYEGARFPYLSANMDFRKDKSLGKFVTHDGQDANKIHHKIAGSAVLTIQGERIGFIGATTPRLHKISSPGGAIIQPKDPDDIDALAAVIQKSVDALIRKGINKIVLLSHMQQFGIELELASRIRGLDILIGGGSDTILADKTDRLRSGDVAGGTYPIWKTSPTGEPVAVLNTDGQYRYVGRLVVGFTKEGVLIPDTVKAAQSGAFATDEKGVQALGNVPAHPRVLAITKGIQQVLMLKDGAIFGKTKVFLNGLRLAVRREETNLGNLTADANLYAARLVDPSTLISFKNGGAIRNHIGYISSHLQSGKKKGGAHKKHNHKKVRYYPTAPNPITKKKSGQISRLDIENALRFNNRLCLLTLTARELVKIVEHGVANWSPRNTPGRFPQISGFSFSYNYRRPAGKRVRSLVVYKADGSIDSVVVRRSKFVGNPKRTYRMVTLKYLAHRGDGYPMPSTKAKTTRYVDLTEAMKGQVGNANFTSPGREQDALAEYLYKHFSSATPYHYKDTPISQDTRIQNIAYRKDTVLTQKSK